MPALPRKNSKDIAVKLTPEYSLLVHKPERIITRAVAVQISNVSKNWTDHCNKTLLNRAICFCCAMN